MSDSRDAATGAAEHYGYEVEYLTMPTVGGITGGGVSNGVRTCAHPAARDYSTEVDPGSAVRAPTLRLLDEQEEEIAAYNGTSWLAIRRLAKPIGEVVQPSGAKTL